MSVSNHFQFVLFVTISLRRNLNKDIVSFLLPYVIKTHFENTQKSTTIMLDIFENKHISFLKWLFKIKWVYCNCNLEAILVKSVELNEIEIFKLLYKDHWLNPFAYNHACLRDAMENDQHEIVTLLLPTYEFVQIPYDLEKRIKKYYQRQVRLSSENKKQCIKL